MIDLSQNEKKRPQPLSSPEKTNQRRVTRAQSMRRAESFQDQSLSLSDEGLGLRRSSTLTLNRTSQRGEVQPRSNLFDTFFGGQGAFSEIDHLTQDSLSANEQEVTGSTTKADSAEGRQNPEERHWSEISEIPDHKLISATSQGLFSAKMMGQKLKTRIQDSNVKILTRFSERKSKIKRQMATAPFVRNIDKLAYVIGTNYAIIFAYFIAKWPHDHIYTYASLAQLALLVHRYITFWSNGWHMFLVDFCYFANFIVFGYINFAPRSDSLFITSFLFGNGTLAAGVMAFRNSFVPHKLAMMTSLALHAVPLLLMQHARWYTVLEQESLPIEEQRFAATPTFESWGDWFRSFYVMPLSIYFVWVVVYGISQFVLTDKVLKYEIDSVYGTFTQDKGLLKVMAPLTKIVPLPIVFLLGHFLFFFAMHNVAVLAWHYFWFNITLTGFVLEWALYQGACYYMDYFAKKYEKQLERLSDLQSHIESPSATLPVDKAEKKKQ